MDLLNLSLDDNEADTSHDELDEEPETLELVIGDQINKNTDNDINKKSEEIVKKLHFTSEQIRNEFLDWERPDISERTSLYSSSVTCEQPEPFQVFFLDSISTISSVKHPSISLDSTVQDFPLHNVIRLFGVTTVTKLKERTENNVGLLDNDLELNFDDEEDEQEETYSASVCCNVHGFLPYFYVVPTGKLSGDVDYWKSPEINVFINYLNKKIKTAVLEDILSAEYYHEFVTTHSSIVKIDVLAAADVGDEIYRFFDSKLNGPTNTVVLKIFCSLPRFVWKAHEILDRLMYKECEFVCFESNINNNIRFLTDRNLPGCSWLELLEGKYFQRNDSTKEIPQKESYCQIELDVHYKNIVVLPDNHSRYHLSNSNGPALRILSFDIEVMVTKTSGVPKDGNQQVIQIGNIIGNYFEGKDSDSSVVGKAVFTLGTCDTILDAKVLQFFVKENPLSTDENYLIEAEAAMLGAWRDFVIQMDPDIIMGYNIKKFDLPYLIDRANKLNERKPARFLPFLGRMKKMKVQVRSVENSLKRVHQYDEANVGIQGRIIMDFYPVLVRHDRLNNGRGQFKLSSVAKRFLNKKEEKQDVHYTEIEELQRGNSTTRNRLAQYCLQDSVIPYLLLFKPVPARSEAIGFIELYFKKCHSGGTLMRYMLNKSITYNDYYQQIRVQKNKGAVAYVPNTPSPQKRFVSNRGGVLSNSNKIVRKLFTESQEDSSKGEET